MTKSDVELLVYFIDQHSEIMGRAGCNDFDMEDTPEHRELCVAAYSHDGEDRAVFIDRGRIHVSDFMILEELKRRLLKEQPCKPQ